MNKKVYTTACVIIPPEEKWPSIQKIRQQYDRQIHKWMPHITLLFPFRPEIQFNDLEKDFIKKCSKIKSFEVTLREFKYFYHKHQKYTIWINPEPNDSIVSLQSELLKIVPDCNNVNKYKKGYIPHLSVGQIKGKEKLIQIINNLEQSWKELRFILNSVYFISRENSKLSKFEITKKVLLNI